MPVNENGRAHRRSLSPRILFVIKLIAFSLVIMTLYLSTPRRTRRVSISGKNLRLQAVFTEIRRQTGIGFICESALLNVAGPVTLNVRQAPLEEVLTICLRGQGLGFIIRDGTIIIYKN